METARTNKGEIFNTAAEIIDPAKRSTYLDDVCADDLELRAEIEDLLSRDADAASFLDSPPGVLSCCGPQHKHARLSGRDDT